MHVLLLWDGTYEGTVRSLDESRSVVANLDTSKANTVAKDRRSFQQVRVRNRQSDILIDECHLATLSSNAAQLQGDVEMLEQLDVYGDLDSRGARASGEANGSGERGEADQQDQDEDDDMVGNRDDEPGPDEVAYAAAGTST